MMMKYLKGIYAGVAIGLGGLVYLSVENRVLGAFLFSIGLCAVLTLGFDLYTGKVCFFSWYKKPLPLLWVWVGNLIGAVCMALLANGAVREAAAALVAVKLAKSFARAFLDALICGVCIAIAVRGYKRAEGFGKYLCVVLGVMVFILAGAEHVVANMFYFAVARTFTWQGLQYLLVYTLGNTIGGFLFAEKDA
ncbi:MAG: formate/nitrite transporter family protein [Lachnospiraceae bacterium]|nr:formate/nitrite transporter family protein [Lachnospiraceae bacterium]